MSRHTNGTARISPFAAMEDLIIGTTDAILSATKMRVMNDDDRSASSGSDGATETAADDEIAQDRDGVRKRP